MVTVESLELRNLLIWNPSLVFPASTLSPIVVEVAAILPMQVGYVPANISSRVEPFQDDLMQQEPVIKDVGEFEPIPLTGEILNAFGQQILAKEVLPLINDNIAFVHQYQNLFFMITGKQADTKLIQELILIG